MYVATDRDSASVINVKLKTGLSVVLSPGIYHLEAALELNYENQVLLGLGLPVLKATRGNVAVKVGDAGGVRVAGILFEAGIYQSSSLLQWGEKYSETKPSYSNRPVNPGMLHDIFARVGGPDSNNVAASSMVEIFSSHVIGDNLWLWRADHDINGLVIGEKNFCANGMVVHGDDVAMYGLAIEHTLHDMLVWNGNRGSVYFYQSE